MLEVTQRLFVVLGGFVRIGGQDDWHCKEMLVKGIVSRRDSPYHACLNKP